MLSHFEILRKYNIHPKKSLGQNFLMNDNILDKITWSINVSWKDVIEVWPWYWALTSKLLSKNPNSLTLVELDSSMKTILEDRLWSSWDITCNDVPVEIFNIDILKFTPNIEKYIVIANIPYYITSPILSHFFYDIHNKPSDMIILMQKDVADKIRLSAWNSRSVLSLQSEFACESISHICDVWPGNFIPPPKVDSSVLHFKLRQWFTEEDAFVFRKMIKAWFSERRKKLISNLANHAWIQKDDIIKAFSEMNLSENIRAEELNLEKWNELIVILKKKKA